MANEPRLSKNGDMLTAVLGGISSSISESKTYHVGCLVWDSEALSVLRSSGEDEVVVKRSMFSSLLLRHVLNRPPAKDRLRQVCRVSLALNTLDGCSGG